MSWGVAELFWIVIGVISVTSIIARLIQRRETEKTIRIAIEHGQVLSPEVVEKLLQSKRTAYEGLIIGGFVLVAFGMGLGVLSFFVDETEMPIMPMLGSGAFIAAIGGGLFLAAWVIQPLRRQANGTRGPND